MTLKSKIISETSYIELENQYNKFLETIVYVPMFVNLTIDNGRYTVLITYVTNDTPR